jgi:hypothetical protein
MPRESVSWAHAWCFVRVSYAGPSHDCVSRPSSSCVVRASLLEQRVALNVDDKAVWQGAIEGLLSRRFECLKLGLPTYIDRCGKTQLFWCVCIIANRRPKGGRPGAFLFADDHRVHSFGYVGRS